MVWLIHTWRLITRNRRVKWLLALSIFILFLVVVISYVEASKNEHFNSVLDVVYFTMVTIATVGYGDITPVTTAGKLLTVILISIGVVIISVMTGSIASILTASKIREGMGLKKIDLNRHVVICGYNYNIDRVIIGIVAANSQEIPEIVLVNSHPDAEVTALIERFPEATIRFVSGDYTMESTLRRAAAEKASAVIILADPGPDGTAKPDDRTLLATLTIKSLSHEIEVCAEIIDFASEEHLRRAGVDQVVLSGEFNGFLLSSSVISPGISQVIREITTIREGSTLKRVSFPRDMIGMSFKDAIVKFLNHNGSILIGIITEKKTFNMEEMLSSESNAIDEFIRRKFDEAGRSLEIESKGRISVHVNPGSDYRISEYDYAIVLSVEDRDSAP